MIAKYSYEENDVEKRVILNVLPETRGNTLLRSSAQNKKITRQFNRMVKLTFTTS